MSSLVRYAFIVVFLIAAATQMSACSNTPDSFDSDSISGAGLSLFPNDFRSGAEGSPSVPKP